MVFLTNVDFDMKIMYKTKLSLLSYVIACITFFHLDISSLVAQDMDSREGDSLALVALYNSTNGDSWNFNNNWLTDKPINEWETTAGYPTVALIDGRVTELFLNGNKLEGPIPEELGNLTKLKRLFLDANKLNGTIPKELGNLTELKYLYLQNNNLTGNIPKELSMLSGLGVLSLAGNELDGPIPPELGELNKIATLYLSDNNLSGEIPKELGNLTHLQGLYLDGNNLTGSIPVELANPKWMQILYLYDNDLSGIVHSELGNISNLALDISNNKFSTIEKFDINSNIERLYVNGNKLGFSSIILNMSGLKTYNNQIVDDRDTVTGTETRSIALTVSDNHPDNRYQWYKEGNVIVDAIDRRYVISNLSFADAGKYYASITNTNFPLDTFWRDTIDLEVITLYVADSLTLVDLYNSMGGSEWDDNINWLSVNPIDTWEGVTATNRVDELDLEGNNLVGVIPSSIGDLDKLRRLDLSNNNLMGSVPLKLANLSDLEELLLNDNNLTGVMPSGLGNLENLTELRLNNNSLTGTIPLSLGGLENLIQLRLNNNNLTGSIPLELRNLTNIEILFFQNNQLDSIEDISSLPTDDNSIVNISNNKIGFISIVPNIEVIDLYNNQLLDIKDSIYAVPNDNLSLAVSDDHEDNSYQWYKNGGSIQGATDRIYSIEGFKEDDAGEYYATIQNTKVPGATFRRDTIYVFINRIEFDSLALISLYNSTNGDGWSNNDNWLSSSPIDSWHGVTIENNRVVSLDLSDNNLTGTIPSSINDLLALQLLNVSDNSINSIEDISSVPVSANVSISNNRIGFVSIVPNMLVIDSYEGQVIDNIDTFRIIVGGSLSLSISDDHESNSYQWYKDGNSIEGATDRVYAIGNVRLSNSGVYYASIDNNATQSNTMIWRDSIYVFINDTITIDPMDTMMMDTMKTDPIDTLSSIVVSYSSLSAYPNPTKDILYIANQANDEVQLSIKINTIEGKLVLHKSNVFIRDSYGIDVSKLSSGIYYVHLMHEGKNSTIKIVKE